MALWQGFSAFLKNQPEKYAVCEETYEKYWIFLPLYGIIKTLGANEKEEVWSWAVS